MGQLLISVAQIVVAVILAAIASYLGILLFNRATRDLDEWAELRRGNAAMGIVLGSIILGIALILRPSLTIPYLTDTGARFYPVMALLIQAAAILLGLILALSAIIFAVGLFDRVTGQIDELAELQQGNLAVAAIMAGVVLAVSLLMSRAVEQIIGWFVAFVSGV
ncbi:MAG: hypothetical protein Kow0063_01590 [Anaerolineae bacterium]